MKGIVDLKRRTYTLDAFNKFEVDSNVTICFEGVLNKDLLIGYIDNIHSLKSNISNLRGGFVIVVYNQSENSLWIARDHLGVMPLYYAIDNDIVTFGLNINSVIHNTNYSLAINENVIHEYFAFKYISGENVLFDKIKEVIPGTIVEFKLGFDVEVNKFFNLNRGA